MSSLDRKTSTSKTVCFAALLQNVLYTNSLYLCLSRILVNERRFDIHAGVVFSIDVANVNYVCTWFGRLVNGSCY
jgi:hypothetical protein